MSPALSLFATSLPLCKAQDISKEIHHRIPLRGDVQFSSRNTGLNRRDILNITGVGLISAGSTTAQPVRAEPEALNESISSRMSYSRFLEYLNEGAVKKVDLFDNGLVAIAEIYNPVLNKIQRVKVQLPGLQPDLVRKLKEKEVNFTAHPIEPNYGLMFLDFFTNFGFPLLFLGTLLLRSSLNNTPGGPNLPFGLGRYVIKIVLISSAYKVLLGQLDVVYYLSTGTYVVHVSVNETGACHLLSRKKMYWYVGHGWYQCKYHSRRSSLLVT